MSSEPGTLHSSLGLGLREGRQPGAGKASESLRDPSGFLGPWSRGRTPPFHGDTSTTTLQPRPYLRQFPGPSQDVGDRDPSCPQDPARALPPRGWGAKTEQDIPDPGGTLRESPAPSACVVGRRKASVGKKERQLSFLSSSTHTGTHGLGVQLQNSPLCILWPRLLPARFLICTMGVRAHPQRAWGGPGSREEDALLGGFGVCILQNRGEGLPRSHKPG